MPAVGLGLWKLPNEDCQRVVVNAIKAGYRLLDGACDYGNEKEVGLGIKQAIDEGLVKRDELWITSKLWNTYHRKEHVRDACLKTLSDLGVDYLDLYLVHFPVALKFVPFDQRYPPSWIFDPEAAKPCMEEDNVSF
jgi:D-xylose reductase